MYDSILFWNDVALEANRVSHTDGSKEQNGPTLSSRALAIVHIAMHDAFVIIEDTDYSPYIEGLPPYPPGAVAQAAVAGAAHATLSALYPSQRDFFDRKLAEAGGALNIGHDFGRYVARAILKYREKDPGAGDSGYVPSFARGRHRVDPDNSGQGFHGPFYGRSKVFAVRKRHQILRPPFENDEYLRALRQVRGRGIAPELMGTVPDDLRKRTIDQTLIGIFWAYDGAADIGTPPRLYNQIVRRIAIARNNTEAQNARLFALVNVAMGDAGILAWEQKYKHDFWRPVIGIREHDRSMGLATEARNNIINDTDTGWLPLGAPATNSLKNLGPHIEEFPYNQAVLGRLKNFTPPFPAYPSGHATFGAAAFYITKLFYKYGQRDEDPLFDGLDFVSDELNGVNQDNRGTIRPRHLRSFPRGLWQMIEENARSRVYLGVHWIFDAFAVDEHGHMNLNRNIGGVPLGLAIAKDIYDNGLKKPKEDLQHEAAEYSETDPYESDQQEPAS